MFEAMKAGCIPLGSLHEYYQSIDEKNIHYIPFNGSYEDAQEKIPDFVDKPI